MSRSIYLKAGGNLVEESGSALLPSYKTTTRDTSALILSVDYGNVLKQERGVTSSNCMHSLRMCLPGQHGLGSSSKL